MFTVKARHRLDISRDTLSTEAYVLDFNLIVLIVLKVNAIIYEILVLCTFKMCLANV